MSRDQPQPIKYRRLLSFVPFPLMELESETRKGMAQRPADVD
jgi:hypothetical protein